MKLRSVRSLLLGTAATLAPLLPVCGRELSAADVVAALTYQPVSMSQLNQPGGVPQLGTDGTISNQLVTPSGATAPVALSAVAALAAGAFPAARLGQPNGAAQLDANLGTTFGSSSSAPLVKLYAPVGSSYGLQWMQPGGVYLWQAITDTAAALHFYAYAPTTGVFTADVMDLAAGQVSIGTKLVTGFIGTPDAGGTLGIGEHITNTTTAGVASNGHRLDYLSSNPVGAGLFDNANTIIADWTALSGGGSALIDWRVGVSPTNTSSSWALETSEINPVNAGDDLGWGPNPAAKIRWVGGPRVVPESQTFTYAPTGTGKNILYSHSCAHSGSPNTGGHAAKTYNCLLAEPDAVGPGGYFLYATGRSTETDAAPAAVLGAAGLWVSGIDLSSTTLSSGIALKLAASQTIEVGAAVGVTCSGAPTALYATTGGVVTHC